MHIRLLALGSRGDVQPYIALGLGLQRAGYDVAIAASDNFRAFIESYGLVCKTTKGDLQQMLQGQRGGRKAKWLFLQMVLDETLRLTEGADALIYAPAAIFAAPHVVEKLGIIGIPTLLQPFLHPTGDFPSAGMPVLGLGSGYNRWTYRFVEWLTWTFTKSKINRWREETLGLPPAQTSHFDLARRAGMPTLYGISPQVLPKPAEWPSDAHLTGYWFLGSNTDWQPPEALEAFLQAGDPPVYIGFGSMVARQPERMARMALDAVQQAGVRGILAAGWGGLSAAQIPKDVLLIDQAPHEWLFPRVGAVVHHGGAGTTAAGLRAGVPSIVVPFKSDQPFWGAQVHRLGAGPVPIPQKQLTAERLAQAIREAVTNTEMQRKAAVIGEKLRAEDGVGNAVAIIERVVGKAEAVPKMPLLV